MSKTKLCQTVALLLIYSEKQSLQGGSGRFLGETGGKLGLKPEKMSNFPKLS